jgi:nucleoside-diphosphate-sugar epimerase
MELQGKVAVVTGTSSGIGMAIAEELSAAGAKLILPKRFPEGPKFSPPISPPRTRPSAFSIWRRKNSDAWIS